MLPRHPRLCERPHRWALERLILEHRRIGSNGFTPVFDFGNAALMMESLRLRGTSKVGFGFYRHWTFAEVYGREKGYCDWVLEEMTDQSAPQLRSFGRYILDMRANVPSPQNAGIQNGCFCNRILDRNAFLSLQSSGSPKSIHCQ